MKRREIAMMLLAALSLVGLSRYAESAGVAGTVSVENRSPSKIKVVGAGGGATLDAGAEPIEVAFDDGKDIGIDVKVWWTTNPRQLCQLFVPWGQTVIVSGTSTILCRSE